MSTIYSSADVDTHVPFGVARGSPKAPPRLPAHCDLFLVVLPRSSPLLHCMHHKSIFCRSNSKHVSYVSPDMPFSSNLVQQYRRRMPAKKIGGTGRRRGLPVLAEMGIDRLSYVVLYSKPFSLLSLYQTGDTPSGRRPTKCTIMSVMSPITQRPGLARL